MHLLSLLHIPENSLTGNPHRRPTRLGGGVARSCRNRMCWSFQGDISRCEHAFWLFRSFCPFLCVYYIYIYKHIYIYICVCVTMLRMYPQFTAKIPTPQIQAWKTGTMKKKKQMYPPLWPWFTYDHHMPSACPCFVIGLQCLLVNLHEIKHNHKTL